MTGMHATGWLTTAMLAVSIVACANAQEPAAEADLRDLIGNRPGLYVVVGDDPELMLQLSSIPGALTVGYFQDSDAADALRRRASEEGTLGRSLYVIVGNGERLPFADSLVDAVILPSGTLSEEAVWRDELVRVLSPGGRLFVGSTISTKPVPAGSDDWTHPYHGPDNNPISTDTLARGPYLTQFLAEPFYGPMPEVTVVSAGRMFKAFGHIAIKEREWPLLNTLVAFQAHNGMELWRRELQSGYMVHRNTLIATPETLYVGDGDLCRRLDAVTGEEGAPLTAPEGVLRDRAWKWMALENGVLYALLGPREAPAEVIRGERTAPGWPWSGLGREYGQRDYPWGFGQTLVAIDISTDETLWTHHSTTLIDSRAVCLSGGRVFYYSHLRHLGCLDAGTGNVLWKTVEPELMAAIGDHDRAQNPRLGFSSTSYMKAAHGVIVFAGPQRRQMVAVSTEDGSMLWSYPHGNFQLILQEDALYALGRTETSKKLDLRTGQLIHDLDCFRGNCTRATATPESIFTRGHRHTGTQRILLGDDVEESTRISLMRPACQDGVVVAGGLLYWGPWMCDCNLSLVGIISLTHAGDFRFGQSGEDDERLERDPAVTLAEPAITADPGDWTQYRAGSRRSSASDAEIPSPAVPLWLNQETSASILTAPITVSDHLYVAGDDGAVRCFESGNGKPIWTTFTEGRIFYPPEFAEGRLVVGSADGHVYCLDAADGRVLWRFRAAPVDRRIPVYGRLSSTWPVGSGVLIDNGIVYAAAGIASYDGTHVYALDLHDGTIVWQNNSSGRLVSGDLVTGVSVQGHLLLNGDQLYLAGGNAVSPAVYDRDTGTCLSELKDEWDKAPRGRELFLVDDEVLVFDRLLYGPRAYQQGRYYSENRFAQAVRGDVVVRARPRQILRVTERDGESVGLWESRLLDDVEALAVTANAVLAAGRGAVDEELGEGYFLVALDTATGQRLWDQPLPAAPESWGLAVDRTGRVFVSLRGGRLAAFGR